MIELVALDIAGTTIDEKNVVYEVLRECVESCGANITDEVFAQHKGTEKRAAIIALLDAGGVAADEEFIAEAYGWFVAELHRRYRENPPMLFPGVREAIAGWRAQGIKVALTTGYSRDILDALLAGADFAPEQNLDAVVCAPEAAKGRPWPYMIHRAMEATGVADVHSVLAAGDTLADLQAAHNAGVIGVGVLTGSTAREVLATKPHAHIVNSVADIPLLPEFTQQA